MASFQDILSKKSIFKDVSILSPHYVPSHLPFREVQIKEIMETVSPALKSQKPKNLFIYGKTGTGKTCSVKHVMDQFNAEDGSSVMTYINCRIYNSRYRIFQKIMKQFVPELDKSGFGLPYLYEKLIEEIKKGKQFVIVLDEIDMVKDLDELVYTLTRVNDESKAGGVSIIGISNKLSFKNELDPRSRSSLYESEIIFPSYTSTQLQHILDQRIGIGFEKDTVEPSAVNLAAAITAQECGDARYALKLILSAGEIAQHSGKMRVTDEEVELARKRVELDLAAEAIALLPDNLKIALYAIASLTQNGSKYSRLDGVEEGFLFSGEVYEEYARVSLVLHKKPRSVRWYREYLNDLEMLGLITSTMSGRGIRGQTTLIKLGYPAADISGLLKRTLNIE